jgi:hypothetical protein
MGKQLKGDEAIDCQKQKEPLTAISDSDKSDVAHKDCKSIGKGSQG